MNDDSLKNLLRQADAGGPPAPPPPGDLALRVRQVTTRRRFRRRCGGAVALASIALAAGWLTVGNMHYRQSPAPPPQVAEAGRHESTPAPPPAPALARSAQIDVDIAASEATINRLLALEQDRRLAAARARLAGEQPMDRLDSQVERAAVIVLHEAEQMELSPNGRDAAAKSYQLVIDNFPDTDSARLARQRLAALRG